MIKLLDIDEPLKNLSYKNIFEGKVKVLYEAYGMRYDFCKFYLQNENVCFVKLDNMISICFLNKEDKYSEEDGEELSAFIRASGIKSAFLPVDIFDKLHLNMVSRRNHLMKYTGEYIPYELSDSPKLDDVFEILKSGFDLQYSAWLTDLSHRIRHGLSKAYTYENSSTVTVLYNKENTAFLTQVATLSNARGKGYATKMLRSLSGGMKENNIDSYLVCRNKMFSFYENVGYEKVGDVAMIYEIKHQG